MAWSRSITELVPLLYEQATATSAIVKQIESDKRRKVWPALRWSQWRCATVVLLLSHAALCARNLSQARKKRQHAHQSDSDSDEDSDAGDSDDSASSTEVTR